jgi:hypothetical protein
VEDLHRYATSLLLQFIDMTFLMLFTSPPLPSLDSLSLSSFRWAARWCTHQRTVPGHLGMARSLAPLLIS